MTKDVRVRFAPSPTGYLHVGGARTALFNYLFAKKLGGKLILRIEDTDIDRSLADSESKILEDLNWLGIHWDEGPDKGGDLGPYRQTQRLDLYKKYAEKLLEEGKAYLCYCTPEELDEKRKKALELKRELGYDGACRNLTKEEEEKLKNEGRRPAIRFKVPQKDYLVDDLIKGKVEFKCGSINDFVILKSDGTASYNFAVAIDDALMKISHVIRGDEHLINTPRQIMIYEALGARALGARALGEAVPVFAHIPMILAPDHTKLSKRHGTTSVGEFREKGYLGEALVNYLALLGWSPGDDREFFTMEELTGEFSIEKTAKNPAIYDIGKLNWMNSHYIKKMPLDEVSKKTNTDKDIIEAIISRINYFGEIPREAAVFTDKNISYEGEARQIIETPSGKKVFESLKTVLLQGRYEKVDENNYKEIMKKVSGHCGLSGKDLYPPVRAALIGKLHGLELVKIFKILGIEKIISRLDEALR